ncbi:aspartate kinase [Romboutsia sp. Marseille-P6047]|uniref:aspartate kinase n=1 Tax=Romboutsia sp. Marseille-P6047 TaxID=2161817 RepID=UPI000F04E909|nr:aspartate kinase [Romboutsia sp. Marseille-P6047]
MGVLVQKFGGTSVESYEKMKEVVNIIKSYREKGNDLAVVVSAMGRKGAPYATDTLIDLCKNVNEKASKRELDLIMSCGEIISGTILSSMLEGENIPSIFLTGTQAGIITTNSYSNAKIKKINSQRIETELSMGKVVVIAGFQGSTEDGDVTTLGRGGSDTSAVAIGKALGSKKVQIYTDVDGIMTADPRVEPDARVIKFIEYEEVFQMAEQGSKVIHPRAVELAKKADIILEIKNTLNPEYEGTKIGSIKNLQHGNQSYEEEEGFISTVAHKNNIAQVKVKSCEDVFSRILNEMEDKKINMDMINFFIEDKGFAINKSDVDVVEEILKKNSVQYEINKDCAKVTLLGSKITETPGVIAKIMRGLTKINIELLQSSDSYTSVSCLVKEKDMVETIHIIHNLFYKNED